MSSLFGVSDGWIPSLARALGGVYSLLALAGLGCLIYLHKRQTRRQAARLNAQFARERKLAELGGALVSIPNVEQAARLMASAADELFGWDAFYLSLYAAEEDRMAPVISIDTIEGRRTDVPSGYPGGKPTPMARQIIESGANLLLREKNHLVHVAGLAPFGDLKRQSASLMFAPIRDSHRVIGILSAQSYQPRFYDQQKLAALQIMADHCGGALERIRARQELQRAHDELESRVAQRTAELTEANQRLREVEQEQQIIFDSVPAAIVYKDKHNRILRANRFHAELVGLPVKDIEGRTVFELSPRFADQYFREDQETIRTGQPSLGLLQPLQRANGEMRWLETDKIPCRDADGNVTGVIVFSIDITERREAEEGLRKAREELERKIQERTAQLSDAVAKLELEITDRRQAESRARSLSHLGQELSAATSSVPAAQSVLDAADELLGWDAACLQIFTPDHRYTVPLLLFDNVDGKRTQVFGVYREVSAQDKRIIERGAELAQGPAYPPEPAFASFGLHSRPTASRLFAPICSGPKAIGILSIQRYAHNAYKPEHLALLQTLADFCSATLERIQAEESLRASEERFSLAFRSSPIPSALTTLAKGTFLDMNDSMLLLLGYAREEMSGRTTLELGLWENLDDPPRLLRRLQEKKSVRDFSCRLRTKLGTVRDVLLSAERLVFAGEPVLLVNFYDMTDRLNLELQLRHSQKMEAVGQLAAGVAHDFNNILTIIQGHAGLVLTEAELSEKTRAAIAQVVGAATQAGALTKQLLTFSRKQVMQLRYVDLNDVIAGAARMLDRLLGESINLHLLPSPAAQPIHADPGMMEQIIVNLALNARDAMPQGGQLSVRTETALIDSAYVLQRPAARTGAFACLSVEDTGTGMDAATLSRIFEPFFTTKAAGKGTGLGLATAYAIVKQHDGWIEVNSAIGSGSVFKIYLPISAKPGPSGDTQRALKSARRGGNELILVVEDEASLRELVGSLLRHFGYRVLEAAHGQEALEIWKTRGNEIDLLFTDMMMPGGISGWELAKQLLRQRPALKVIYSSGYSVDLLGCNGELGEGAHFLPKPYQPNTLAKVVRDCLDERSKSQK